MRVHHTRSLTPLENLFVANNICPFCTLSGIQWKLMDNEGHGGYTKCPHCHLLYFPVKGNSLAQGLQIQFTTCGECGYITRDVHFYPHKDGGQVNARMVICESCGAVDYMYSLPTNESHHCTMEEFQHALSTIFADYYTHEWRHIHPKFIC